MRAKQYYVLNHVFCIYEGNTDYSGKCLVADIVLFSFRCFLFCVRKTTR